MSGEQTYAAAGVSLATADAIVERLRAAVESTRRRRRRRFGAFAGLYRDRRPPPARRVDGLRRLEARPRRGAPGRLRWCGADLAAHCINDVLTTGAEPLFFLDYVAANRSTRSRSPSSSRAPPTSAARPGARSSAARRRSCPGIYREDELDFCGTCVGVVDRDRLIDGSTRRGRRRRRRLPLGGHPRERFLARPRVIVGDDRSTPICCCRRRASTSTTSARCGARRRRARSRTSPAAGSRAISRACSPDGLGAASTRTRGSGPPVFALARATRRRRGRAPPRLQHRHRLLRRRPPDAASDAIVDRHDRSARDRRPRQRRGDEPAGADRCGPADRRRRVEPARRPRARAGRGCGHPDGASSTLADFAAARRATRRWRTGSGARRRASSCSPATCTCCVRTSSSASGGRVVNTHSAPLPAFPGAHPIEDVLAAGVRETAATVHYVDEGIDTGPVIRAERVPGRAGRHAETLRARVQAVEHRLLPEVVRELIARDVAARCSRSTTRPGSPRSRASSSGSASRSSRAAAPRSALADEAGPA